MNVYLNNYVNSFKGLRKEVWYLALITFINRAGAMVVLFLSVYMSDALGFTKPQIGWVMTAFGIGSFIGSFIGGKLTDSIGYYKVMYSSLFVTGISFFIVQQLESFEAMLIGVFSMTLLADIFRPAIFVAIESYSKPENKVRSVTLIRLAINLGFSLGPALAGFIVHTIGYFGLFWVDGFTCIFAGIVLLQVLHPKRVSPNESIPNPKPLAVHKDYTFLFFLLIPLFYGFSFIHYFSAVPLYYKEVYALREIDIGLLLALNGIMIFIFEMPLVHYLESKKYSNLLVILGGCFLSMFSFLLLNWFAGIAVLIIAMLCISFGEMITLPFTNVYTMERAKRGKQGAYMGLYSMAFSLAHIFGHNTGMHLIDSKGYLYTWYVLGAIIALSGLIAYVLYVKKEKR